MFLKSFSWIACNIAVNIIVTVQSTLLYKLVVIGSVSSIIEKQSITFSSVFLEEAV